MDAGSASRPWQIVLLEDDEDDYILARSWLGTIRPGQFEMHWARTQEDGLRLVSQCQPDVILVDYDLGANSGLDFVRALNERQCPSPVVMLTGRGNFEVDLEAMQAGATDYLPKNEASPQLLERTIRYAIERGQREEALRQAKEELEIRVQARTQELTRKNLILEAEIAERRRVEAELAELQRRLIESVEAERLQLAQELHDGPMQDLYGLAYQLQTVRHELQDEGKLAIFSAMQDSVNLVISTLRATTGELRPPTLAPFGLEKAIRSHSEQFQQAYPALKVYLHLTPDGKILPESVRLALFRIYQIALTNVARHARAKRVVIRLLLDAEKVVLEIHDDGIGFDLPSRLILLARQGQYGLVGAAERAAAIGGSFKVESKPGEGTLIRVEVPLEE
jgi:signal transduction histidine kinase